MTASPARTRPRTVWSLRRLLLTGILLPVLALIALNAWSLYQQTLASLHTAYDRTLLASAKSIATPDQPVILICRSGNRSAQAAKEIKGLIENSVSRVNTGSEQVSEAGTTMKEIVAAGRCP